MGHPTRISADKLLPAEKNPACILIGQGAQKQLIGADALDLCRCVKERPLGGSVEPAAVSIGRLRLAPAFRHQPVLMVPTQSFVA